MTTQNRPADQSSYLRVKSHLDDIAKQIRAKDLPLEKALDLYEEAIRLGNTCADLIDTTDFSLEELEMVGASEGEEPAAAEDATADGEPAADADGEAETPSADGAPEA